MAHIHLSRERVGKSDPQWHAAGLQIGELANKWSDRYDIVAFMADEVSGGAPAAFKPLISEVEVSTKQVFGNLKPEQVGDLRDAEVQYEHPKVIGAVLHEALHAKYSLWSIEDASKALNPQEFEALMLLEEGRIEAHGAREMPWGKNFLQSCAMDLVIADAEESFAQKADTYSAATMVALVHPRLMVGILNEKNLSGLLDILESVLSVEVINELREVIKEVQAHSEHTNPTKLYALAKKWVKIVNRTAKQNGDPTPEQMQQVAEAFAKAMRQAMKEASESTEIANAESLQQQEQKEKWDKQVKSLREQSEQKQENAEKAKEVFSRVTTGISGSRLKEERLPDAAERAAAVTVARLLEQAKYRERSMTEVNSFTPPGRLRTRSMVQGAAMKSRGVIAQVEPWRKNVRKHTEDPTLTVGVMVDISGSMGGAMQPMATTAWVLSEAVKRVNGRTAMVYYGSSVFPTLKPGQHLDKVRVYTADDSTEEFDDAFRALDGGLNLLNGEGARLLVVVSDGHYRQDQRDAAKEWVKKCGDAGVAVLWMPFEDGYNAKRLVRLNKNAQVLDGEMNPAKAAQEIGLAASMALSKVSANN